MRNTVRWGLVAHTTAVFSLTAITTMIELATRSYGYIDRRKYPGDDLHYPGPVGYPVPNGLQVFDSVSFPLSQWLADGLLVSCISNSGGLRIEYESPLQLYRCHVIYSGNSRVTALPSLVYASTIGTCSNFLRVGGKTPIDHVHTVIGMVYIYENARSTSFESTFAMRIDMSYFAIALALNIILTSMILIRLVLHSRTIRKVIGPSELAGGLYRTVITMLVESFSIYAIPLLLYIATWASDSFLAYPFSAILGNTQVRTTVRSFRS